MKWVSKILLLSARESISTKPSNNPLELLKSNFLFLKETYFLKGKKAFNLEYKKINGLGKVTSKVLLASFENQRQLL